MSAYRRVLCWTLVSFLQTKGYLTKLIPVAVSKVLYLLIHKFKRKFYGKPSTKSWKYLQIPCSDALPPSHRERGLS